MLKVLHGADFHLDSPFSGLKPDAAARAAGRAAGAAGRLTDLAREREARPWCSSPGTCWTGTWCSGRPSRPWPGPWERSLPRIPGPGQPRLVRSPVPLCRAGVAGERPPVHRPGAGGGAAAGAGLYGVGSGLLRPPAERLPLRGFHAPAEGVQLAVLHGEVAAPGGLRPHLGGGHRRQRAGLPGPGPMSTSTAACAGQGRLSGLTPAAPRGVALTSWEKRACSGWRWRRGGQRRNSSPCAAGGIRSCPWT